MGEWNTVFEGEVEGRLVTVKVYRSADEVDREDDENPAVRVTAAPVDDYPVAVGEAGGEALLDERVRAVPNLVALEPYSLDDLEGELMEVGFSPESAASIASKVGV